MDKESEINELRKKVSSEEVDPALHELNTRLGEARQGIQRAAEKGWEAWDAGQQKAQRSVESLQKSVAEAADRLQRELGRSSETSLEGD